MQLSYSIKHGNGHRCLGWRPYPSILAFKLSFWLFEGASGETQLDSALP